MIGAVWDPKTEIYSTCKTFKWFCDYIIAYLRLIAYYQDKRRKGRTPFSDGSVGIYVLDQKVI